MKNLRSMLKTCRLPAVAAVLALAACSHAAEEAAEEDKVTPVEVAEVQTSSIRRMVAGEGVLFPLNQATVTSRIPGMIRTLLVNRGDHVKKGQLLAELEARDLGATVTEAQAMVAQAEAAMRNAAAEVSRDMSELAKEQAGLNKDSAELSKNQAELNRETAALAKDTSALNQGLAQVSRQTAAVNRQTAELNSRKASSLPEDIRKAELDLERAAAAVDASKKALDARQDLFAQGALARRQVEEANLAYTQARTDRDAAQNHLDSLRKVGTVGQQEAVKAVEADVEGARAEVEGARAEVEGARAQIETSKAQVEAAKAQVLGAQAQVEATRAQVEGAKAQLEGARAQLEAAKSQLDAAKARTEGAAIQVSYARLSSPIDGIVSDRPLYAGELAGPEKPLLTVMDVSRVIARANVSNAQLPYLKYGDTATVEVAGSLIKANGKVTVIAPAIDPNSSTAEVWVEIDNPKGELRPGTVVNVSIVVETVQSAIVVPIGALLQSAEGETIVLVVTPDPEVPAGKPAGEKKTEEKKKEDKKDDKKAEEEQPKMTGVVRETRIVVGIRESTQVQVLDGLKAGDLVVIVGGNGLEDKAKVEIKGDEDDEEEEEAAK